jgi:pilus assembly protein CpaB
MLKGRLPLILAAVFAVLAAVVAYLAVKQKGLEISAGWEPVWVLVAKKDMPAGTVLTQENLTRDQVPKRLVTPSVITDKLRRQGLANVFGQKLASNMHAGDILLFQHIATATGGQHLADAVQDKGRAVSVRVSAESAVHHWIEPSDRVDVIGVFRDPRTRELVSLTMLQNVIVLATGRISGRTNKNLLNESDLSYNTVTLHVLPEAVEMLVLAQNLGSLYLSLRNPEDNEIKDLTEGKTTMTTLLTGERSKRISTKQNKIFKVEIIRAGRKVEQVVP